MIEGHWVGLVTAGPGTHDARRAQDLVGVIDPSAPVLVCERSTSGKLRFAAGVLRSYPRRSDRRVYFIEGSGLAAILPALAVSIFAPRRVQVVWSSGDAMRTFVRNRHGALAGAVASFVEGCVMRRTDLFVGWSPYLSGRAISMGAKSAVSLEGNPVAVGVRRSETGRHISWLEQCHANHLVIGVIGSINWNDRQQYCYGYELVRASRLIKRDDVRFVVVGDGSGLPKLRSEVIGDARFIFTGRLSGPELEGVRRRMDAAVIAQSADELGMLRLTTKLPEFLNAGTPLLISGTVAAIDYLTVSGRQVHHFLPLEHPSSTSFARAIAQWIENADKDDLRSRKARIRETYGARFNAGVTEERFRIAVEASRIALPGGRPNQGRLS